MNNITKDDYTFVDHMKGDFWAVKLLKEYEDVVYRYGKVTLEEIEDGEAARVAFRWELLDSVGYDREFLENDPEFQNYIGDVLTHIIQDSFDTGNYKLGDEDVVEEDNVSDSMET